MSKPKKSFSAQMGGNSASAEIAKFETGDGGVGVDIVHIDGRVEPKKASARGRALCNLPFDGRSPVGSHAAL